MPRVAPWDLPVVSQPRMARMAAIAEGISRPRRIWVGESMGGEIRSPKFEIRMKSQVPNPNQ